MSRPSTSRHHADWLSLVEISGPFVSLPVLLRAFPQGLEPRDPAQARALRTAYEEWQDTSLSPGKQRAWVLHVLTKVLGYPATLITEGQSLPPGLEASMPEMGETLRPDFALVGPPGSHLVGQAQLLVVCYPAEQILDKPVTGKLWKATPATRMLELLHGADVPLGLVTNGEHWMMVYGPRGETSGFASWFVALWQDEPLTLRAFHSLLGIHRFFGVAADSTLLALLKESVRDQQEVADQLGYQVREAVEVLVQSFDAIDKESNRNLLKDVSPTVQYEAALTVMMRLVFLFSAEERSLLHLGKPLYDDNYAVSTLQEQLQEVADRYGEEVLERRNDAWVRLLATFRAIHGGIQHQDLLMQAYGGSLFDPDRYSFLEGRTVGSTWRSTQAEPLAVNNRVVLHLLSSLQRLRTRGGLSGKSESRRISFRALGVEQIGHIYEGMLDHTALRASVPVLGMKGTRSKEPELSLEILETLLAQSQAKLVDFLKEETGRSVSALNHTLEEGNLIDEHKFLVACDQGSYLLSRVRPFIHLIREDSFERPVVVLPGSVYVTAGSRRRSTGTHYTPPTLTEPVVQHTLEPLVYEGPAEGWPREQWKLKSPEAILDNKVCDMAMGSGAFLVQVCRYLAERLVESWENEEKRFPGKMLVTPAGRFSEGVLGERLLPVDPNERISIARRVVADRCLYGVDINPMAVEMAKLSLWLITVDASRPFNFLDHAFKCGDSLLGITSLDQLEHFSLRPGGGRQQAFASVNLRQHIDEAKRKREAIEGMPSDSPEQIMAKTVLYAEAEAAVAMLDAAADALVAMELKGLKGRAYEDDRDASVEQILGHWAQGLSELQAFAARGLADRQCFHWALAFPEVMERGGFDAFVGNPPFQGGTVASTALGTDYMALLKQVNEPWHGKADLVGAFIRQGARLSQNGFLGFLATASLCRGETADCSLAALVRNGMVLYRARSPFAWPGVANVSAVCVWLSSIAWRGDLVLDDKLVEAIGIDLEEASPGGFVSYRLTSALRSFLGVKLSPTNQPLSQTVADAVRRVIRDPHALLPAIGGDELGKMADPTKADPAFDESRLTDSELIGLEQLLNTQMTRSDLKHSAPAKELRRLLEISPMLMACAETTHRHLAFSVLTSPESILLKHTAIGIPISSWAAFASFQSSFHELWAWKFGIRRKMDLRYLPKRCGDTFPCPMFDADLEAIGERYFALRRDIMAESNIGLTALYNRFHDHSEVSKDIRALRKVQVEMDRVVAKAYGWQDLDLSRDYHTSKQGVRFTISDTASRAALDRTLALNHLRHAEEETGRVAELLKAPVRHGRKKKDTGSQIEVDL